MSRPRRLASRGRLWPPTRRWLSLTITRSSRPAWMAKARRPEIRWRCSEPSIRLMSFERSRAGPRRAARVGGGDENRVGIVEPEVVVVAGRGVQHGILRLLPSRSAADLGCPPPRSAACRCRSRPQRRASLPSSPISSAIMPARKATSTLWRRTFWRSWCGSEAATGG